MFTLSPRHLVLDELPTYDRLAGELKKFSLGEVQPAITRRLSILGENDRSRDTGDSFRNIGLEVCICDYDLTVFPNVPWRRATEALRGFCFLHVVSTANNEVDAERSWATAYYSMDADAILKLWQALREAPPQHIEFHFSGGDHVPEPGWGTCCYGPLVQLRFHDSFPSPH